MLPERLLWRQLQNGKKTLLIEHASLAGDQGLGLLKRRLG